MNNSKKIRRAICAVLAASMMISFAGCKNSETKNTKTDVSGISNVARKIENYFTSNEISLSESLSYAYDYKCSNGDVYFRGYPSSEDIDVKVLNAIYDRSAKSFTEFELNIEDCSYVENTVYDDSSKKLYINYSDKDYNFKLGIYDVEKSELIKSIEIGTNNSYIVNSSLNSNGNLFVLLCTSEIASEKYEAIEYDINTLEEKSKKDISNALNLNDMEYVSVYTLLPDQSAVALSVKYSMRGDSETLLRKIDASGNLEYQIDGFDDMPGIAMGAFLNKDGELVVMTCDYDNGGQYYINSIDVNDGSVIERFDAPSDMEINSVFNDVDNGDYDFLYTSYEGLFGYKVKEAVSEKLVDFEKDLSEDYNNCYRISPSQDKIYLSTDVYGDGSGNSEMIYCMDTEGNVKMKYSVSFENKNSKEYGYISSYITDTAGNVYVINENHTTEENDGEYSSKTTFELVKFSSDGQLISKTPIPFDDTESGYIQTVDIVSDNELMFGFGYWNESESETQSVVFMLNTDTNEKTMIEVNEEVSNVNKVIVTSGGEIYFGVRDEEYNFSFRSFDKENKKIGDKVEINADFGNLRSIASGDSEYDFYCLFNDGIQGVNIKENKVTEIINWIDSDIDFTVNDATILDKDSIICSGYDGMSGRECTYILKRADEETLKLIQNKKILTIAGVSLDSEVTRKVVEFNRGSNEYRMQLNDYGKFAVYDENTSDSGASKLNTDIAAGNIPDIIIGSADVDMYSYGTKGLLTDLNPLIDADAEINREDYLENIFNAYAVNGKLYEIVPKFGISTIAGKPSVLGTDGWTFETFLDFANSNPVFFNTTREILLDSIVTSNLLQFVNFAEHTCSFDDGRFAGILEYIKREGVTEADYSFYDDETKYKEYLSRFNNGKCNAEFINIWNFDTINEFQKATIGEEAVLKGYPSADGNGHIISSNQSFGISSKSENIDGAWQFVRQFLLDDYQMPETEDEDDMYKYSYTYGIPVKKSAVEAVIKNAQNSQGGMYIEDYKGESINVGALDDATAEKMKNLIESVSLISVTDKRINEIITEQTDLFFNGGQTAEETAAAVQSKVSLYMKEIK